MLPQLNKEHTFAFFVESLNIYNAEIILADCNLIHRFIQVIRIKPGDRSILFDRKKSVYARCIFVKKESIGFKIESEKEHIALRPHLSLILPLLKKEAFEYACSVAVTYGVQNIFPVLTEKTHRATLYDHERKRIDRLMIAVAEQSKQLVFPTIHKQSSLRDAVLSSRGICLVAHQTGKKVQECIASYQTNEPITIVVGPEGDFTDAERDMLSNSGAQLCCLTTTVLRSEQAASLLLGIIRSFI